MNFISGAFAIFICVFLLLYFVCPPKFRYVVILVGSYIFYAYADIRFPIFLLVITLLTYFGGLLIYKQKKKSLLTLFFGLNILILAVFKYTGFILDDINIFIDTFLPGNDLINVPELIVPVGLSFIVFQSSTYLTDIYYERMKPEKNILLYGSFVAFFPCLLSGPIQKARTLIPQLHKPMKINEDLATKGVLLFMWGFFEKVMIANRLASIIDEIYCKPENYSPTAVLACMVLFSFYIYADFSSYSDMARGISLILGIDVGKNFDNPYLSKSTSEFWNRWHMSLNSWFLENIYIPLGGSRKGEFRKYLNVMIIFTISGIWHGADNNFIVWGVANGLFVVIGKLLEPTKKAFYKKLNIDENVEGIVFLKRLGVFILITFTWIFFKNGLTESLRILECASKVKFIDFFNEDLTEIAGNSRKTIAAIIALAFFAFVQLKRRNEEKIYVVFKRQPFLIQLAIFVILIYLCVFASWSVTRFVNSDFVYFDF